MKKLMIAALALSLFAACNNDKKDKKEDASTTDTNTTTTATGDGGWTADYKTTFMNQCIQGSTAQMGAEKANAYCSCMYDKLKTKYPLAEELNNMDSAQMSSNMKDLAVECMK